MPTIMSYGRKHGAAPICHLRISCRDLPNPYSVPRLRPLTGQHPDVQRYVYAGKVRVWLAGQVRKILALTAEFQGQAQELRVAVECTGGKHRSVAVAEALGAMLGDGWIVVHRDLHRD